MYAFLSITLLLYEFEFPYFCFIIILLQYLVFETLVYASYF